MDAGADLQVHAGLVGDPKSAAHVHQVQRHAGDLGGVKDAVLSGDTRHHHV